jgi:hypothetical protein
MAKFRVLITCVEVYEGEAENAAEAEELAHAGQFGDAVERWDTDEIKTEEV